MSLTINIDSLPQGAPVRVYWNRTENPEENWCVDFGPGTVILIGASVTIHKSLVSQTVASTNPEADPRGWLAVSGVGAVHVNGSCMYLVEGQPDANTRSADDSS